MLAKLRSELKKHSDKTYNFNQFFKTPIKAYGVRYPVLRKLAKKHCPDFVDEKLCDALWKSGMHEEAVVAIAWAKQKKIATLELMKTWLDSSVSNWSQVDDICLSVLGPMVEKDASLIPKIKSWTKATSLWTRRASAVAFVIPGRHGHYLNHIFDVSKKLMHDPEDLVQKGYGWALKEASKPHQRKVFEFVLQHKKKMTRTALRYAIELLPAHMKRRAMAKE
ncbi:MAG TPA: DNA alkylation repair protein [Candidatus Binatia bacterium]|nr:DNA alkylation repair protein [Candidatus Binatia bacterium]